jgi:hypothetical protein
MFRESDEDEKEDVSLKTKKKEVWCLRWYWIKYQQSHLV